MIKNFILLSIMSFLLFSCSEYAQDMESGDINTNIQTQKQYNDLETQTETGGNQNTVNDTELEQESPQLKFDEANQPIGFTDLQGYYTIETKSAWGEEQKCDAFVITGGNQDVIDFFVNGVNAGNQMSSLNEQGDPIVNINITSLVGVDEIKSSTPTNLVTLSVAFHERLGFGAPTCYPAFEIREVSK